MKRLLTSCFGLGWMPVASGTWGSLPPAVTLALLGWSGCSLATQHWVQWLWLIYGCVACVALAPAAIASTGKKDPGEVVVDEVAGQAVTFLVWLWLPVGTWTPMQWVVIAVAGFLLFRVFDIFKPTPAHQLESLPRGWGILADDLMVGIYAGLVLVAGCWVVHHMQMGGLPGLSQDLDTQAAVILGAIQGVTEFLPVSSSGHLVLLENLMGFDAADSRMVLFDLATHLGTVLAVVIVMHQSCLRLFVGLGSGLRQLNDPVKLYQDNPSVRFAVLAVVGTCVTAVPAILLKDYLTAARGCVWGLGLMWILTGTLLYLTDLRGKTHRQLRQFGLLAAAVIGLAQLVAIMPGVSRSGSTICAAVLICGLRRRWAIEYSMLLGVIAIVAATALEVEANWSLIRAGGMELRPLIVGAVTALLVGIPALKWLIYASRRARFRPFALYCYVLAILALFLHFME